jgi:hypothetical protein
MFRTRLCIALGITLIATSAYLLPNSIPSVKTAGQTKERKVKSRSWRNEPIEVISIRGNGEEINLGQAKLANDDWLRNLTITIKNISKKEISFVDLELHFLRSDGSTEQPITAFPMAFGTPPLKANPDAPTLTSGNTWQTVLSTEEYANLQRLLLETGYGLSGTDIEIIVREVHFKDNKKWFAGADQDESQARATVVKKKLLKPSSLTLARSV